MTSGGEVAPTNLVPRAQELSAYSIVLWGLQGASRMKGAQLVALALGFLAWATLAAGKRLLAQP